MAYVECKIWPFSEEINNEEKRYKAMKEGYIHCTVKALLDTSSNYNFISKRLVDKLGIENCTKQHKYQRKLQGIVGYLSCLYLSFQDRLVSGSDEVLNDFEIVEEPKADLVLGSQWIWLHGTIIDVYNKKFSIHGEFIPLCDPPSSKC